MAETTIEWCRRMRANGSFTPGYTFNGHRGCTRVSAGCAHCFAATLSKRNPAVLGVWGKDGTRTVAAEAYWRLPIKWDAKAKVAGERHIVFSADLGDVFEDWQGPMLDAKKRELRRNRLTGKWGHWPGPSDEHEPVTMADVRTRLFNLILATPNLDWLLLTKRPENIPAMVPESWMTEGFPRNIWAGTSIENQATADERIPHLLRVPAAVRFLSVEPMLGPIDFRKVPGFNRVGESLAGWWCIVGGESGPGARPFDLAWARSIVAQCKAAGVPTFVKQLGSSPYDSSGPGHGYCAANILDKLRDKKGGDISEFPDDLRVREFPAVAEEVTR